MPDNDRVSIDNLTTAPDLGSNDVLPVVHEVSGVKSTFKATLTAIGTFINKILNYSADLQTTNKTVIGAINELHNGGGGGGMSSDIIADTYDDTATYNTGDYCIYNDGLYVCDDDNVTGAWDSTKWTSIQVMSSIPTNAELLPIQSGIATNTKDYIESGLSGKQNKIQTDGAVGTTTTNGNISITRANKFVVLSAWTKNSATIVNYYADTNADSKGYTTWTLHFMSVPSHNAVASTNLTYYYSFIEVD